MPNYISWRPERMRYFFTLLEYRSTYFTPYYLSPHDILGEEGEEGEEGKERILRKSSSCSPRDKL
jgi:hypothetical protein